MTILRRRHNGNFTIVPNAIFEDKRLSSEAKGTLGYLLSRPQDWTVRLTHIGNVLRMGRHKTERVFQELKAAGYVVRGPQRRTEGRWGAAEFLVLDDPHNALTLDAMSPAATEARPQVAPSPCPEKPSTVEPSTVIQGTYKDRKENKTDLNNIAADARADEPAKSLITTEAFKIADALIQLQHLDPDDPRSVGMPYTVQGWLAKGWRADLIYQAVAVVMARRTEPPNSLRYFEAAIAEAHAEHNRPLPVITTPKGSGVRYASNRGAGGFARNAIRFAHRNGGGHPT
jgi:hypothetical protein